MKKILLASVLAIMVLGLAAVAWGTTHDIVYDGYCDGVFLDVVPGGAITGNLTDDGCPFEVSGPVSGRVARNGDFKFKYLAGASWYGIFHVTVIRHDGTWTHYNDDGSIGNSGTWSYAPGRGERGTEPSAGQN